MGGIAENIVTSFWYSISKIKVVNKITIPERAALAPFAFLRIARNITPNIYTDCSRMKI